ncbi:MAG: YjfB family protein [Acetatifactor sp.]|nr:YjfB family protein [Acetatifactor sp.]
MDIAGLSMSMATLDVQSQVGIKMLSKAIDMGEDLGAGMVQMIDAAAMERSVNPAVGGNVDIRL